MSRLVVILDLPISKTGEDAKDVAQEIIDGDYTLGAEIVDADFLIEGRRDGAPDFAPTRIGPWPTGMRVGGPLHEGDQRREGVSYLRQIGWLDQKGRVWLAPPPSAEFDGGSLTPLLIDAGL